MYCLVFHLHPNVAIFILKYNVCLNIQCRYLKSFCNTDSFTYYVHICTYLTLFCILLLLSVILYNSYD